MIPSPPNAELTETPSSTPTSTVLPALALPDATGTAIACANNALTLSLDESFDAVSRIIAQEDWLYILADGDLYRIERRDADAGVPHPEPVLVHGQQVAGRPVQELVDLAADPATMALYALDKVGHVYRYEPITGALTLVYRARPQEESGVLEPQFAALTVGPEGQIVLLDTAHATLWTPETLATLTVVNESRDLAQGVDVAYADGAYYVIKQDGSIGQVRWPTGMSDWRDASDEPGPALSLLTSEHLGKSLLYLVNGLGRSAVGLDPETGQAFATHRFAFPTMGLLRDIGFAGGRLYAVADATLFVYPGLQSGDCPPRIAYDRPLLYGVDVLGLLSDYTLPIEGATLPPWPRLYPGANRLYRLGVHRGLDIHRYTAPPGFGVGTPVLAMANGRVVQVTENYTPVRAEEFERLVEQSETLGQTPAATLQRLYGRQVVIEHTDGVQTLYAHLDSVAPGVVIGAPITRGQVIGEVGVSGTQGEGQPGMVQPHLHVEIWLNGCYLGQGITIRETMWWFEQLFGE